MYRKLIYILALFLLASCGAGRSLKKAEQSYARGEYFDAANIIGKLMPVLLPSSESSGVRSLIRWQAVIV